MKKLHLSSQKLILALWRRAGGDLQADRHMSKCIYRKIFFKPIQPNSSGFVVNLVYRFRPIQMFWSATHFLHFEDLWQLIFTAIKLFIWVLWKRYVYVFICVCEDVCSCKLKMQEDNLILNSLLLKYMQCVVIVVIVNK